MQPTRINSMGLFGWTRSTADTKSDLPRVVFNARMSRFCIFDSNHLVCFHGSGSYSQAFTWNPSCDFKEELQFCTETSDLSSWSISTVMFANKAPTKYEILTVFLINSAQNRSLICYFPNPNDGKCTIGVSVHGIISCAEWIIPVEFVDETEMNSEPNDSQSILSATMELSGCFAGSTTVKKKKSIASIFSGCLALGFRQGFTGLLDLCLDWEDQTDQVHLGTAVAVAKSSCSNLVSSGQRISISGPTNEHALVYLDASVVRWDTFNYKSVKGNVLASIPANCVYVSALLHIPQIQSLVVGFSFGGWQLWSLKDLGIEFCLRQASSLAPVIQFAFLEPADDPRFCCYLWVGWQSRQQNPDPSSKSLLASSSKSDSSHSSNPVAKLYQFSYKRRIESYATNMKDPIFHYKDLIGLAERLSTTLLNPDNDLNSELIAIQALHGPDDFNADGTSQPKTVRLISLIWRLGHNRIRIGLFDLDRWYHAQMPTQIRSDNSFFAIFDAQSSKPNQCLLNGKLLESSLISLWSRITERERRLTALCKPFAKCSNLNSCVDAENAATASTKSSPPKLHLRPVPEVCLRPSALSFSFLMVWSLDKFPNNLYASPVGGFLLAQFVSRQEACLVSLSQHLQVPKPLTTPLGSFNIIEWISEAWATGLLESPGLDPMDDEDLVRLLRLSNSMSSTLANANTTTAAAADKLCGSWRVGADLAYGEDLDENLLRDLDDVLLNSNDRPDNSYFDSSRLCSKRQRISADAESDGFRYFVNPAWVLLANILLEHGYLNALKNLEKLAYKDGSDCPVDTKFKCVWLWLRFCRLKARFDRLTSPLFTTGSDWTHGRLDSVGHNNLDAFDLGSIYSQLLDLTRLAKHWFYSHTTLPNCGQNQVNKPPSSSSSVHSIYEGVKVYTTYARLVLFLYRLGLLPQNATNNANWAENHYPSTTLSSPQTKSVLPPYDCAMISETIAELLNRSETSDSEADHTFRLTHHLLNLCLDYSDPDSEAAKIWCEQEGISRPIQSTNKDLSFLFQYPPRRIQSVCALWQLPSSTEVIKARLGLLGFLLCDSTASGLFAQLSDDLESKTGSKWSALRMCRYVMSLFVKEFPAVRPLLPTILLLWLIDRNFFKEINNPKLIAFLSNTKTVATPNSTTINDPVRFVSLFPDQVNLIMNCLKSNGQQHLVRTFLENYHLSDNDTRNGACCNSDQTLLKTPTSDSLAFDSLDNLKPTGAPWLALSQFRSLLQKMRRISGHTPGPVLNRMDKLARETLVQLAEACRRVGRLGDLVSLGLNSWEAKVLFDYYHATGQFGVLFHCLISRNQYKTALAMFNESQQISSQIIHPHQQDDANQLSMMAQILISCVPEHHEDHAKSNQTSTNALVNHFVESGSTELGEFVSPTKFVVYQQPSPMRWPHTLAKNRKICSSMTPSSRLGKRSMSQLPLLLTSLNQSDSSDDSVHDRNGMSFIPATDKKRSREFWDNFKELERALRSYEFGFDLLSMTGSLRQDLRNSLVWPDSSTHSLGAYSTKSSKLSSTKREISSKLFKSIYTPPYRKKPSDLKARPNIMSMNSPFSGDRRIVASDLPSTGYTPISILKSSSSSRTSEIIKPAVSEVTNLLPNISTSLFSTISQPIDRPANEVLEEDEDLRLNLSTIRPSLAPPPNLNAVPLVPLGSVSSASATKFTFSEPKRLSLTPKPSTTTSQAQSEIPKSNSGFCFAAPLVHQSRSRPKQSYQDRLDSPTKHDSVPISEPIKSIKQPEDEKTPTTKENIPRIQSPPKSNCPTKHDSPIANQLPNRSGDDPTNLEPSPELSISIEPITVPVSHTVSEKQSEAPESLNKSEEPVESRNQPAGESDMDFDDNASVTSTVTESSITLETPRRSRRRVKPPKRYDASAF